MSVLNFYQNMKQPQKGFTIIELLVVFAIIGIISAVVLALLSKPRSSGADAAIKGDLRTIQTQSQLFYGDNNNRYNTDGTTGVNPATACTTAGAATMFMADQQIKSAIAHINTVSASSATCYMTANGSSYLVWIALKTSGYWCVDSTGISKSEGVAYSNQTAC